MDLIKKATALMLDYHTPGNVERLDRLAELLVFEAKMGTGEKQENTCFKEIEEARKYIENHYLDKINYHNLAARLSISISTFRRYWKKYIIESPADLINRLKMEEACHLLQSTEYPIEKISELLHFPDRYYFSKCFKKFTGETAWRYRLSYRKPRLE